MVAIPQSPIINAGERYMTGLSIAYATAKTMTISEGQCRDSLNINDIVLGTYSSSSEAVGTTINGLVIGANGMDTAVLAASTLYAVYVIADSTGNRATAGILSTSTTGPSLPFGYDMFRRIGWVATNGSSNLLLFYQYGKGMLRSYFFDVGISVLSGGAATSFTAVNLTTGIFCPPQSVKVFLQAVYTPNSATNVAEFIPGSSSATNGIVKFGCGVAAAQQGSIILPATASAGVTSIKYKVAASDTLSLSLIGFEDYLYPPL